LPEHVKTYDDGGVVNTLSPGDKGTGAAIRAHQVALEELNSDNDLASHKTPDKVESPYADTKGSKVPNQHAAPKGEKSAYKMAQDILKSYDKGGKVNVHDGQHEVAILKQGERVLTEKQNKEYEGKMKCYDKGGKVGSMGMYDVLKDKGPKGPKKVIKTMEHSKTHNGKHVVTHKHHAPFDGKEHDEVHMHGGMEDVHKHMDANEPQMSASPAPPDAGAGAPPMPGAAGPGAGAPPAGGAPPMGM
jgi:hypothetical protein